MDELYAVMMSWAVTLSGYPAPINQAEIIPVPHAFLVENVCGGRECKVMGWYPPGGKIHLDGKLNPKENLYASSILLHEMVHFLQQESGKYRGGYTCSEAMQMEREAYGVQREYLLRYGVYQPAGVSMHLASCEVAIGHSKSDIGGYSPLEKH